MLLRRFAIASTLIVTGAVLASPAMADTVQLRGTVLSTSTVTSTATAGASALNLYGVGTATPDVVVHVADLALTSNSAQGVTLSASSTGLLRNPSNETLAYQVLIVANGASAPSAASFTAASVTDDVLVGTGGFVDGAASRDLYIEYDAPALLDPGAYAGSITVTVADK